MSFLTEYNDVIVNRVLGCHFNRV